MYLTEVRRIIREHANYYPRDRGILRKRVFSQSYFLWCASSWHDRSSFKLW